MLGPIIRRWRQSSKIATELPLVRGRYGRLHPVHAGKRGVSAVSKAGRVVLRGEVEGVPVKIFEAFDRAHAEFIAAVSESAQLGKILPSVIAVHDSFVVVKWVEQGEAREVSPRDLAALYVQIHSAPVADLPSTSFCYWTHVIWPRFVRAVELLGDVDVAEEVYEIVSSYSSGRPTVLVHPDVTPVNVIRDGEGQLRIVDNELLTLGSVPLLDVCNTAYALGEPNGSIFAAAYCCERGIWPSDNELNVLKAAWVARLSGTALVAGRIDKLCALIASYKSGDRILPFTLDRG